MPVPGAVDMVGGPAIAASISSVWEVDLMAGTAAAVSNFEFVITALTLVGADEDRRKLSEVSPPLIVVMRVAAAVTCVCARVWCVFHLL